jgi:hypothetical protein
MGIGYEIKNNIYKVKLITVYIVYILQINEIFIRLSLDPHTHKTFGKVWSREILILIK